jgi:hypothetical protein
LPPQLSYLNIEIRISKESKLSLLTKKQNILRSGRNKKAPLKSLVEENLKSTELDRGIHFFDGQSVLRVANQFELRQKAYEYLYKVYLNEGYTREKKSKLHLSIYYALPDTITLFVEDQNGNLNGTLTMVFDSNIGLPSDLRYKKEIDKLRGDKCQICEIVSLGIDRAQRGSVRILAGLFYYAFLFALHIMASTDMIINVIPSQANFYCKNLLFQKIGNIKKCPRANGVPAVLLNMRVSSLDNLRKRKRVFPFAMFQFSEKEEIKLAKRLKSMLLPMSDLEFYTFFIEKTDLWEKASDEKKNYIKKIYPADQTDHFSISRALAKTVSKKYQK